MTFNEPTSDTATPKTVLITGCSSGYGLETARHFHDRGWNVVATMRTPREDVLPQSDRLRMLALDVTKAESVAAAVVEVACGLEAVAGGAPRDEHRLRRRGVAGGFVEGHALSVPAAGTSR